MNQCRTARAFTLTEALVAVFAIALISVALAAIFASVGDTVERGRRVSEINQFAAGVERRLRRDIDQMTRDGVLVIRNEYAGFSNASASDQLIQLSPDAFDTARFRRIDELMFFARGSFESARSPMNPNRRVRSNEARIYYGHGLQQLEGDDGFFRPFLIDPNAKPALRHGVLVSTEDVGEDNPNAYAGDWTLLRHVTLLAQPSFSQPPTGRPFSGLRTSDIQRFFDNNLQIGEQPAAESVFRSLNINPDDPNQIGNPQAVDVFGLDGGDAGELVDYADLSVRVPENVPGFQSGIVDIATTSLAEIKRQVTAVYQVDSTGGQGGVLGGTGAGTEFALFAPFDAFEVKRRTGRDLPGRAVDAVTPLSPSQLFRVQQARLTAPMPLDIVIPNDERVSLVHAQHAWMTDALPAASNEITWEAASPDSSLADALDAVDREMETDTAPGTSSLAELLSPTVALRSRLRYEATPPGYNVDVLGPTATDGIAADEVQIAVAAARADQQMVTSSQFIPRCTEFIVEWSFGERYNERVFPGSGRDGEIVWYGAPREPTSEVFADSLRPTGRRPASDADPDILPGVNGPPAEPLSGADADDQLFRERHLLADLIVGDLSGVGDVEDNRNTAPSLSGESALQFPTTYHFGYADPRAVFVSGLDIDGDGVVANVDDNGNGILDPGEIEVGLNPGYDIDGDGRRDDIDGDGVYDDAWPWPKLLRITMSFADPTDQTIEETFQFVVEVPSEGSF